MKMNYRIYFYSKKKCENLKYDIKNNDKHH